MLSGIEGAGLDGGGGISVVAPKNFDTFVNVFSSFGVEEPEDGNDFG